MIKISENSTLNPAKLEKNVPSRSTYHAYIHAVLATEHYSEMNIHNEYELDNCFFLEFFLEDMILKSGIREKCVCVLPPK